MASPVWGDQRYVFRLVDQRRGGDAGGSASKTVSHALSGNERNRLFLSRDGNYEDLSLVSGADDSRDGRSFAWIDFDQDGWVDIALAGLNSPRFRLLRNRMAEIYPERSSIALRLVGESPASNRDAIGAKVIVSYRSGEKQMSHRQAGRGFAGQNSGVIRISETRKDPVLSVEIHWPSGKVSGLGPSSLRQGAVISEEKY